jgi:hypothetical protein
VARTVEQVESFRRVWTGMVGDEIQTDPNYFLWSLDGEPQVVRPHVLAVDREGRTDAMLVARLSEIRLPSKLGYRTVYAPVVRGLSVVHEGLLGREDDAVADAVLDELSANLAHGDADVLLFRQLRCDSRLREAAQGRSTFLTRQRLSRTHLRWLIDLPATFDDYLASLSTGTRKGIRRTISRIEKDLGNRVSTVTYRDPGELDRYFQDAERVAARTYQRRLGVGFRNDAAQRGRAMMLASYGLLRGWVLYIDGLPVAFEQGEAYRNRFVSRYAGYDPSHRRSGIGTYLLAKTIESLVEDRQVSVFDFGFGDADYKRKLGHRAVEEGDLVLYARRARPIRINVVRTGLLGVSHGFTGGLRRLALLDASKDWWRRRRVGTEPTGPEPEAPPHRRPLWRSRT